MLNRDFTRSNKEYFKKNRIVLISIAVFLIVGIVIFALFGLNGNFEINGYNEFSVSITEKMTDDYNTHKSEIGNIVNSYDGRFDSILIYGEGEDTKYVVRYLKDVKDADTIEINKLIAEELKVNSENISEHIHVNGTMRNTDVIFTAVAILLLVLIASIFAFARYNGASALSIIISCLLGTLSFISIGALLRLYVGMSYFAMLVILNVLMIYFSINLFETMHKSSWLISGDYAQSIKTAMKASRFRTATISLGLMVIGLLFVLFGPLTLKYASLNIMFMSVIFLAVSLYVVPFCWSVFISHCKQRTYKIKASSVENKK